MHVTVILAQVLFILAQSQLIAVVVWFYGLIFLTTRWYFDQYFPQVVYFALAVSHHLVQVARFLCGCHYDDEYLGFSEDVVLYVCKYVHQRQLHTIFHLDDVLFLLFSMSTDPIEMVAYGLCHLY